jgi:hypothetical protein
MKVLIDGNEVKVQNDVCIIYDGIVYGMDDKYKDLEGELHVVLNYEGIVLDLINPNSGEDSEIIGTMSNTAGEMAEWCI